MRETAQDAEPKTLLDLEIGPTIRPASATIVSGTSGTEDVRIVLGMMAEFDC